MPWRYGRLVAKGRRRRIALLDTDPYLALLVRQEFPEAEVLEVGAHAQRPPEDADLVAARIDDDRLEALLEAPDPPRTVAIAGTPSGDERREAERYDAVLLRPYSAADVARTFRDALGLHRPRFGLPAVTVVAGLERWLGAARIGTVALAAVLEFAAPEAGPSFAALLAVAFVYAGLRAFSKVWPAWVIWTDVVLAVLLVAASGGVGSAFGPFALFVACEAGLRAGRRRGTAAGAAIALAAVPSVWEAVAAGEPYGVAQLGAWFSIFPVAALASALAGEVYRLEEWRSARVLTDANQILSDLYRIALAIPGGFEKSSIAASSLEEAMELVGSPGGLLLVEEVGFLSVAASKNVEPPSGVVFDAAELADLGERARFTDPQELPRRMGESFADHPRLAYVPARHGSYRTGLLILAWPEEHERRTDLRELQGLAVQVGMALANAELFGRVREISVDAERRRLAAELHDGIAQVLAHLRLELDLLAETTQDEELRANVQRLGRVIQRGLHDVRSTISGLRASVQEDGLAASLRDYVRDLRALGGPEFHIRVERTDGVPDDAEGELFRIAQEALSNALRHAQASNIDVALEHENGYLRLAVDDDGVGVHEDPAERRSSHRGGGIGLGGMQDRADRIGAALEVLVLPSGGTRVEVRYPLEDDRRPVRGRGGTTAREVANR